MPTSILTGSRYPASSAAPNVPQDIQNAVIDLEDNTVPAFTTTAARDTAYTNWTSAGNSMRDGLTCSVAGFHQIYRSGAWHGVTSRAYGTTTADTGIYTASHDVMTVSVPDPGFSYQVHASGSVLFQNIGTGVQVGVQIAVNGNLINPLGRPTSGVGSGQMAFTDGSALTDPMTGAATVTLRVVVLISGAPTYGFQCTASDARNKLSVLVIPA